MVNKVDDIEVWFTDKGMGVRQPSPLNADPFAVIFVSNEQLARLIHMLTPAVRPRLMEVEHATLRQYSGPVTVIKPAKVLRSLAPRAPKEKPVSIDEIRSAIFD